MADHNVSIRSVISRCGRPESGRLKRMGAYRWMFNQVHTRAIIFNAQITFLFLAIFGFYHTSHLDNNQYIPIPIPGLDGLPWFTAPTIYPNIPVLENLSTSRNLLNSFSYISLFSAISALFGIKLSEISTAKRQIPSFINPSYLLLPSFLTLILCFSPFILWTLRTIGLSVDYCSDKFTIFVFFNSIRFIILPITIIWSLVIYIIYGFYRGVLYYHYRSSSITGNLIRTPIRKIQMDQQQQQQLRKPSPNAPIISPLRFTLKRETLNNNFVNLFPDSPDRQTAICQSKLNTSLSPRSFIRLETVDEEGSHSSDEEDQQPTTSTPNPVLPQ